MEQGGSRGGRSCGQTSRGREVGPLALTITRGNWVEPGGSHAHSAAPRAQAPSDSTQLQLFLCFKESPAYP